jgi:cytochrome c oxidase subunit 2
MIGSIVVMEPGDFQQWLAGGATGSMASAGEKLFSDLGCGTCHRPDSLARGPSLQGLFGGPVRLVTGEVVTADESYVREAIVNPSATVVEGFQPVMPTYQGLIGEEGLMQLIAYIQSLGEAGSRLGVDPAAAPGAGAGPGGVVPPSSPPPGARPPEGAR